MLEGHNGGDAAGNVIKSFGDVVIGGNYVVGFVVFIILMIINFVVITKGGERISEVSARFTLDALPGKQMAIDADLNAGLINQKQAKARRKEIGDEAEFYGSMDGASKFVRGDAVAGLLILCINLIGGILIGIFTHHLSAGEAFQTYALLTIGDGLVAQIPSLLLATSAAIIVTRVSNSNDDMSTTIRNQILSSPSILYAGAGVMTVMGVVPNMPHFSFLTFAAILGFVGWQQSKIKPNKRVGVEKEEAIPNPLHSSTSKTKLHWSDIRDIEPISLSIGFKLVKFISQEKSGPSELLISIKGIRKSLSEQVGFLIPEITVRDDLSLDPEHYVIYIDGEAIESGNVMSNKLMAVSTHDSFDGINGVIGKDPAYNMPALWIESSEKSNANNHGYQVINISDVIATHVSKVISHNLASVFNYDDVHAINQKLAVVHPKLSEALEANVTPSLQLQVIRQLLKEQVPVTNIKVVANTILDAAQNIKDPILIANEVRIALKRTILNLLSPDSKKINLFTVNAEIDSMLRGAITQAYANNEHIAIDAVPIDPNLLQKFQTKLPNITDQMQQQGITPILLTSPQVRPLMSRYARSFADDLIVLSFNEIADDYQLNVIGELK